MNIVQIVILSCVGIIIILLIALVIEIARHRKLENDRKSNNVRIVDGVRYTPKNPSLEDVETKITHLENDIILVRGVTYKVDRHGPIIPGKYMVLANQEGVIEFNLRLDGFVRSYKHNTDIVLAEGQEICAVSHQVILR